MNVNPLCDILYDNQNGCGMHGVINEHREEKPTTNPAEAYRNFQAKSN